MRGVATVPAARSRVAGASRAASRPRARRGAPRPRSPARVRAVLDSPDSSSGTMRHAPAQDPPNAWTRRVVTLEPKTAGIHIWTNALYDRVPELRDAAAGVVNLFVSSGSHALTINENADPDVRSTSPTRSPTSSRATPPRAPPSSAPRSTSRSSAAASPSAPGRASTSSPPSPGPCASSSPPRPHRRPRRPPADVESPGAPPRVPSRAPRHLLRVPRAARRTRRARRYRQRAPVLAPAAHVGVPDRERERGPGRPLGPLRGVGPHRARGVEPPHASGVVFAHVDEGDDDMPAHVKATLCGPGLVLPLAPDPPRQGGLRRGRGDVAGARTCASTETPAGRGAWRPPPWSRREAGARRWRFRPEGAGATRSPPRSGRGAVAVGRRRGRRRRRRRRLSRRRRRRIRRMGERFPEAHERESRGGVARRGRTLGAGARRRRAERWHAELFAHTLEGPDDMCGHVKSTPRG